MVPDCCGITLPSAGMGEQNLSPVLRNPGPVGVAGAGRGMWQTGVLKERTMVLSGVIVCEFGLYSFELKLPGWIQVMLDTWTMGNCALFLESWRCSAVRGVGRRGAVCAQAQRWVHCQCQGCVCSHCCHVWMPHVFILTAFPLEWERAVHCTFCDGEQRWMGADVCLRVSIKVLEIESETLHSGVDTFNCCHIPPPLSYPVLWNHNCAEVGLFCYCFLNLLHVPEIAEVL